LRALASSETNLQSSTYKLVGLSLSFANNRASVVTLNLCRTSWTTV